MDRQVSIKYVTLYQQPGSSNLINGPTLFAIKYVNLYQQPGSSNLIGWRLELGITSYLIQHDKG